MILLFGCKNNKTNNDGEVIRNFDEAGLQDATLTPSLTEKPSVTVIPEITDVNHEGQMRSYVSGLWVSEEIGKRRPYAFQFNNFKVIRITYFQQTFIVNSSNSFSHCG